MDSLSIILAFYHAHIYGTEIKSVLAFATTTAVVSLLVLITDWIIYFIKGSRSLLGIRYKGRNFFLILVLWGLGAFFVGGLGIFAGIFANEAHTAVLVGIGWPVTFTKLVKKENGQAESNSADEESEGE